jgi:hypothetical protein
MNDESSTTLLRDTLRATAFMIVPIVAFLAVLSAVALFAVPQPAPSKDTAEVQSGGDHESAPRAPAGARASVKPSKI